MTQRFLSEYAAASKKNLQDVEQLRRAIENYQMKLDMLGVTDADVVGSKSRSNRKSRLFFNVLVLAPLALLGSLVHGPIAFIGSVVGRRLARGDWTEIATYKLITVMISTLLVYTAIAITAWIKFGFFYALSLLVLLSLSGWATVVFAPFSSSLEFARNLLKLVPKDLKDERATLKRALIEAVNKHADPSKPRLFNQN